MLEGRSLGATQFGDYLLSKGTITPQQFNSALTLQSRSRLLGQVAKNEKHLSEEEVLRVLGIIKAHPHLRFGEIALTLGYLTVGQVRYLLDTRIANQTRLGEILVNEGALTQQALHEELAGFSVQRRLLERVLICEPDMFVARQLKAMLVKHGYEVELAKDGAAALDAARQRRPDILIAGEGEKGPNGYDVCRPFAEDAALADVRPIYLSARLTPAVMRAAFDAGAAHFLRKPLHQSEVINLLIDIERGECKARPEKILIVDDSAGARAAIRRELAGSWSRLYMAGTADTAIETALKEKPDLIIMDADMPVVHGLHACRMLKSREETENIPVMLLSAGNTAPFRRRGFEAGAVEYCTKPFKAGELAAAAARAFDNAAKPKPERIMVVSGDPARRHIINYCLVKNGYSAITANSAHQAVRLLPFHPTALVVADAGMDGMDGIELTRHIKRSDLHHRIPVIVVTGGDDGAERALAAGANDCLAAPFDDITLLAAVNVHLCGKTLIESLGRENIRLDAALRESEAARRRLESLVAADPLTGLANRRGFDYYLREKWRHARREKEMLSLLMIDIDCFKQFNDGYGHQEGDECLQQVAATLRQWTRRAADLATRYGGEEFAVILPGTAIEAAARIAEEIRAAVEGLQYRHEHSSAANVITVSVGVASLLPGAGVEMPHLVKLADQALYRAKHAGRNRVAVSKEEFPPN